MAMACYVPWAIIQAGVATTVRQLNYLRTQVALRIFIHQLIIDRAFLRDQQ
jgi:hypothetical protein